MEQYEIAEPLIHLSLKVAEDLLPRFCLLTGDGFIVRVRAGCSIRDLLCVQLGVPTEYLQTRIQTIFLNGEVVDNPQVAVVPSDSTIALSAAMPGVAGAMLRKGSPYAPMRSQISYPHRGADDDTGQGRVVIKLFNLIQGELGPAFLRRGIQVPGKALSDLFRGRATAFRPGILAAHMDDAEIAADALFETSWTDHQLLLRVSS